MASLAQLRVLPPAEGGVWNAAGLAKEGDRTLPTVHSPLDTELPGAGWPVGSLIEVLQPRPEQHVWQLLLPSLANLVAEKAGPVVLVGAPFEPFGPSVAAQGLPGDRILCIRTDKPSARLWACEQALRCADVLAVLAWLPQAKSAELRRLHLAAQQHDKLLFAFRPLAAQREASPARVRLRVEGVDTMQVHVLKRRGPPLEQPLVLPAQSPRVAALLQARKRRVAASAQPQLPSTPKQGQHGQQGPLRKASHVLDRSAAPA